MGSLPLLPWDAADKPIGGGPPIRIRTYRPPSADTPADVSYAPRPRLSIAQVEAPRPSMRIRTDFRPALVPQADGPGDGAVGRRVLPSSRGCDSLKACIRAVDTNKQSTRARWPPFHTDPYGPDGPANGTEGRTAGKAVDTPTGAQGRGNRRGEAGAKPCRDRTSSTLSTSSGRS